jgi:hypothetical protein
VRTWPLLGTSPLLVNSCCFIANRGRAMSASSGTYLVFENIFDAGEGYDRRDDQ